MKRTVLNVFRLSALVLTSATVLAFFALSSSYSHAEQVRVYGNNGSATASARASVTVSTACSFTSTLNTAHTAEIIPGTYRDNIGKTTFNVICNDSAGFSIYAVGNANGEFGNTKLLATVGGTLAPSYDIVTGTAMSGSTSNWAMKLTPVAGTTTPTIENGYSAYSVVPATYTKVATFPSATDASTGASVEATYSAFVSGTQPAGTYAGRVKYVMVHPASEAPVGPKDATPKCISYWPNASGVTDTMADDCNSGPSGSGYDNSATAELWASNFQRPGYGFAGWTDKFDWVLNANDANGNGTGANAGYHIYGPNATIATPADMATKGLSLYAVWVPNSGNLQSWTGCSALASGAVTALTDTRDNNVYAVAKLADGNCWMIENLRLADKKPDDTPIILSSTNTNSPISIFTQLGASQDPTSTAWCTNTNAACYDQSMLFSGNTTNPASNMTASNTSTPVYSYGNYYNWYSATAGNGTYRFSTDNNSVTGDICPAGWNLPKGGNKNNTTSSDFWKLGVAITGAEPANTSSQKNPYYTGTPEGTNASNKFRSYPNNFVYSGSIVYGSSVGARSTGASYWSSTVSYNYSAYSMGFGSSGVSPGTSSIYKSYGVMARCMVSGS